MHPVSEKYPRRRIRELTSLEHKTLGPPLALLQFDLISIENGRKHQLDLVTSEPSSWTSVSAASKLHLRFSDRCKLVLFLVLWCRLSKMVEPQAVKSLGIWIYV